MKAVVFLTDGFEEMEALTAADILSRAGVDVELVSLTAGFKVRGSHGIVVMADSLLAEPKVTDMLVLPGGPGAAGFIENERLVEIIKRHHSQGKYVAAICAAPVTLGKLGILDGKTATCYPGLEDGLIGAAHSTAAVVTDGNIITGRGPGVSAEFGLALVAALCGADEAARVRKALAMD